MKSMKKRGQVALFLIVGIVILVGIITVLYLKQETKQKAIGERVDPDLVPVQRWVNDCVATVGTDAIKRLALQGGYLQLPDEIADNPTAYVTDDPNALLKVPFWDYKGDNRVPSLNLMEAQISEHIKENLLLCIGDFEGFKDLYNIKVGNMTVGAVISDDNIVLDVEYPLELSIKTGGSARTMKKFGAMIDARLGRVHRLAEQIMNEEARLSFMENITIDLVSINPNIPFTGLEFSCNPRTWLVEDVKKEMQKMFSINFPRIRVKNTNHLPFERKLSYYEDLRESAGKLREALADYDYNDKGSESSFAVASQEAGLPDPEEIPDDAYDYFHLFVDAGTEENDLKASFAYDPGWGITVKALPSRRGMLRSNMAKGQRNFFSFLCINQYHFVYDIIYPVRVTVRDDKSFAGNGFNFQFAFAVMINDNLADRSDFGTRDVDFPDINDAFCQTREGSEIEITARDALAEELNNATIGYKCFNIYCDLGQTKFQSGTSHYRLVTQLPAGCKFPYLYAQKPGYLEAELQYLGEENVEIPMVGLRKLPVSMVKHVYQSAGNSMGDAEPLAEDEKAVIIVSVNNGTYDQYLIYPALQPKLDFVEDDAEYSITIMLIKEGKLIGKARQEDKIIGGYSNEKLKLGASAIAQAESAVFHVFDYRPTPARKQDAAEVLQYLFDGEYLGILLPEFR